VFEVALNEALMGLSMLEVGKVSSAELCEEAVLHLQKALNFFSSSDLAPIKWKLFYYLALAAVMIDQKKSLPHEKMRWRNLAVSWIAGADRELQRISNATGRVSTEGGEIDFSPGLKPEALGSLKESLGIDRVARPKRKAKGEAKIVIPANEQLH
jgi:hypothetical protein